MGETRQEMISRCRAAETPVCQSIAMGDKDLWKGTKVVLDMIHAYSITYSLAKVLYKVSMLRRCYGHEVVKDREDGFTACVNLLRYWQIELMDGREMGSLCQHLSIISHNAEA